MSENQILWNLSDTIFSNQPIEFKSPKIVQLYKNQNGNLVNLDQIKYFHMPRNYPLNLNKGYENYNFRPDVATSFEKTEKFIMSNAYEEMIGDNQAIHTQRSVLLNIMTMPYALQNAERYQNFQIYATKFGDALYLAKCKHADHTKTVGDSYPFKFRQYCFSDSVYEEPKTEKSINEADQSYAIYRAQLKEFELLYSAEIDGIFAKQDVKDLSNMQEVNKCNFALTYIVNKPRNARYKWQSHPKMMKAWIQASLANVADIYVGLKGPTGYINTPVQHEFVRNLPKHNKFEANVCFQFLHNYLRLVSGRMATVDCPYTVYVLQYDDKLKSITYKVHTGKNEYSFLSESFIEHSKQKKRSE